VTIIGEEVALPIIIEEIEEIIIEKEMTEENITEKRFFVTRHHRGNITTMIRENAVMIGIKETTVIENTTEKEILEMIVILLIEDIKNQLFL
jgi:hypothetical protein